MKKIICALALLVAATSLPAQDKIVRKARTIKDDVQNLMATPEKKEKDIATMNAKLQEAMTMVEEALASPETKKEVANAWDIKAQLHKYIFSPLLDNVIKKQPTDTVSLAANIYASLEAMENCYKATQELGLKGEKDPYTAPNKLDVVRFRPYIAYCGQMFFTNHQYAKAVDAFRRWMSYPRTYSILGDDAAQLAADQQTPQIAYFTCLAAYNAKDYKTINEYIATARTYEEEKGQVNQLYTIALIEQGDTAAWAAECRRLVIEDPSNESYAQNLLAYYFNRQKADEAQAFADEILAKDPDNKLGNYSKGIILMNANKYLEAITFFDKAIEADPSFSDAYYNAGVCYSNHGYDINEKLSGKQMTQAQYNAAVKPVKEQYQKAEPYFLKVQELEPNDVHKWATRLRTIYYILGDKAKEKEMDALCK